MKPLKKIELPPLPYKYNALEPVISQKIMELHHDKHHLAYVKGANTALEKLVKARKGELEIDVKALLRDLSFHMNGHLLHSLFWNNMQPPQDDNLPGGLVGDLINKSFGSFEAFKREFSGAAKTVEGVGWAILAVDDEDNLYVVQIEKHNLMHIATLKPLLVLDVWEHAYYLDYLNNRARYVEEWWKVVNWDDVDKNLQR
jgi:Fe-Mn family superoxide dismutase